MAGFQDLAEKFNEDYGKDTAVMGDKIIERPRCPTGIFPLDLALGGGIPRGVITELFGIESSGKSNIALKFVASHQRLYPELKCAYIDVENGFDPIWAKKLGVDIEKLFLIKPNYGEQAVDMIEGLLASEECGAVVLDSLAALMTSRATDNSAEKMDPGGSGMLGKVLFTKVIATQREAERNGRYPTFLYINQIRHKIGVMFGSPETTPGGFTPRFSCAMRLRLYGKDIFDKDASPTHAARKQIHVEVKKNRCPIVGRECVFEMALIHHGPYHPGDVESWKFLWQCLKDEGMAIQINKKWALGEEQFDTQSAMRKRIEGDAETEQALRGLIIRNCVNRAYNEIHPTKKD